MKAGDGEWEEHDRAETEEEAQAIIDEANRVIPNTIANGVGNQNFSWKIEPEV